MTQSSKAVANDDASADPGTYGGLSQTLLPSLPSPAHRQAFLTAVETALLGQSGICLTEETGSGRAAFVDQLAAVLPESQVVVARLGRAATPLDLQSVLEAAGGRCPRLGHVLLVVSDADALRRDTLDQLNKIAGDLLARRQGLQLLLAGHPRLIDRLRVIRHANLLRYLETRLALPALGSDAPGSDAMPPAPSHSAAESAKVANLALVRGWRPGWVAGASVVAASVLLVVGGLTLAVRQPAPNVGAMVAVPRRLASIDTLQPAIVPPPTMSDAPGTTTETARQAAPPLPSELPSVLAEKAPDPAPDQGTVVPATPPDAVSTVTPTPPALERAPAPMLATSSGAPPALATAPGPPDSTTPAVAATPSAPDPAPLALASATPAPNAAPASDTAVPAPDPATQQALDLDAGPGPTRPAGPGLLLVAERGDTLARLYQRIYAGAAPPPYAAVLAVNRGPVQPGARLLFPAPPGGWPFHSSGVALPEGPARTP